MKKNTLAHRVVGAAVVVAGATSCVNFDIEEQYVDTRILGARTTPAEIMFSPLFLLPANQRPPIPVPPVDVQLEVFAFDPRGGDVTMSVQMCPEGAGDSSCRLYDKAFDDDYARLVEPAKSEVADLLTPVETSSSINDEQRPVGLITPAAATYTITAGAIDFFQPKNAAGENVPSIFPLLPRFAVEVENTTLQADGADVFKERAFKRLPLSIDLADPSLPASFKNTLANSFGISLCERGIPGVDEVADDEFEGLADCLYSRNANENPDVQGFRLESVTDESLLTEGTLEGEPDVRFNSLLRVSPGGVVAVTPVWAPGAVERYQIISFDIDTSKVTVVNRVEDMALSWYASRGLPSSSLTSLENSNERLGVVWNLPTDAQTGERDSLILVAMDQRGGTTVVPLTVEYR